jgi:hypothetical protein
MAFAVFSFRSVRLMGLVALLGAGLLGGASKAAVVNINLTGYTGDNGGAPVGDSRVIFPFAPNEGLFATNQTNVFSNSFGSQVITGVQYIRVGLTGGIATTGAALSDTPIKFGAGATIDGSYTFVDDMQSSFKNPVRTAADFGPNSFLGFRTSAGQFGYIEVTWTASTNTFRLISAAYESTAGVAIQTPSASSGGEVPEPASAMIASLFLGGAALKRWRSKRS